MAELLTNPYYVLREVVGRFLVSKFAKIHYRKLETEDGQFALRVWFDHWTMTSIIFTFYEAIDAVFETGLPDLVDLNKELCPDEMQLKERLQLIQSYICACNDLIEKYGLLCVYATRLETKFKDTGIKFKATYDLTGIIATYILYIQIPDLGLCSFDVTNKYMLFSMEPHIPREVFGIHVKPEERHFWLRVRNSEVPNLYYTIIGDFELDTKEAIYLKIEKAMECCVSYIEKNM